MPPAIAILAAAALALGIAATTAIYTFIQTVLLKPLPYANPDRYVRVLAKWRGIAVEGSWSYPDCVDLRQNNRTMAALGCLSYQAENLATGKQTRFAQGAAVGPLLMRALGVPLEAGTWFNDTSEDIRSAVISDHLWHELGAPRGIVGKQISLNSRRGRRLL